MIEINLLPKELQRKRFSFKLDKTILLVLVAGAAVTAVLGVYSFVFQANQYASLEKRLMVARAETAKYTSEIAKIDEITSKKDQIIARMTAIQTLDRNREYWVALLEDLTKRVPEYVWLTSVKQAPSVAPANPAGQQAQAQGQPAGVQTATAMPSSVEGYSFSLNALATFMIRLKKSDLFDNIQLSSVKLQELDKAKAYSFKLTCDLVPNLTVRTDVETAQATGMQDNQY